MEFLAERWLSISMGTDWRVVLLLREVEDALRPGRSDVPSERSNDVRGEFAARICGLPRYWENY